MKILITGGSEGLGLSMAREAINRGWETHICGRDAQKLSKAKEFLNSDSLTTQVCDISDASVVKKMFNDLQNLDVLINNAGIWLEGELVDYDDDYVAKVVNVNLTGLMVCTKYALKNNPQMKYLINISSTSGVTNRPDQSVYAATKWGVRGFTESLIERYKNEQLKVIGIYPGGMNTELFTTAGFPKDTSKFMSTDEVAKSIFTIFDQPDNMVSTSVVINKKVG